MSTPLSEAACGGSTAAECCGGTTAGCVAVWCCCPCGLVSLLVLAVYKVPASLCRKALRHHRRKRPIKRDLFPPLARRSSSRSQCRFKDSGFAIRRWGIGDSPREKDDLLDLRIVGKFKSREEDEEEEEDAAAVAALEKEMWIRFCGTGFWRSSSQIETTSLSSPSTAKTGMLHGLSRNETTSVSPSTPKGGLLGGPLQMDSSSSLSSTPKTGLLRGPSPKEAVTVPTPRGSFTAVFNNASLIVVKQ